MSTREADALPEIREILGAMLFAAKNPISLGEIRKVLKQVAEEQKGPARDFAALKERDLAEALEQFRNELAKSKLGLKLVEVNRGYRLVNHASCGPWLRELLERGRAQKLSKPALETLAIIAYRQPCTRAEIEAIRGVEVDQIVRNLLELQLIRITGRSELAGRPFLLGTTARFMEHFGLKSLDDLPGVEELRRMEAEQAEGRSKLEASSSGPERAEGDAEVLSEAEDDALEDDDELEPDDDP